MINKDMKKHVKKFNELFEIDRESIYTPPLQVLLRFEEPQDPTEVKHRLEKVVPDIEVKPIENEDNKEFAFLALVGTNDEEINAAFPDADVEITKLPSQDGGPKMLGV